VFAFISNYLKLFIEIKILFPGLLQASSLAVNVQHSATNKSRAMGKRRLQQQCCYNHNFVSKQIQYLDKFRNKALEILSNDRYEIKYSRG
jgi:hypothetical protein